ncbi:MAG: radical SAM protein [Candidatus Omnitrophica bacterium]|nr:radical SAM protein [Candidatus Omnitrophota bacterium]
MKTFHIQWHITNLCNLRCRHCYQDAFDASEDISFLQTQKLFENLSYFLKENRLRLTVDVTGGEPFLHPNFWKILMLLEQSNVVEKFGIITNGTLLSNETIKKLNSFKKLKTIKISCEGVEKESYQFIRRLPYEKFLNSLEKLSLFSGEKLLMFTITQINTTQIPLLFEMVNRYNLDGFIVERFFPLGTGKQFKNFVVSKETWADSVRKLLVLCEIENDLRPVAQYRGFKVLRKKNNWRIFGAVCIVGKNGCAIMPDGSVFPCRRFVFNMGNAVTEIFEKIWEKNPCKNIKRKKLKGLCGICKIRNCYGCRALAYCLSGDYLAQDPLCFLEPDLNRFIDSCI